MPTDTWWNLDDTKRGMIIAATLTEFATHHYDDASLSAIVKQLGIAKGSMYQYFTDKSELYEYLLRYAHDTVQQAIAADMPIQLYAHADMFAILRAYLQALDGVARAHPEAIQLIQRSISETHPVSHSAQMLFAQHQRLFAESLVHNALANRSLRHDVDVDVVIFVITSLMHALTAMPAHLRDASFIDQCVRVLDQGLRYRLR